MRYMILSGGIWGVAFILSEGRTPQPLTFSALAMSLAVCVAIQLMVLQPGRYRKRLGHAATAFAVASTILYGFIAWRSGSWASLSLLAHTKRIGLITGSILCLSAVVAACVATRARRLAEV